MFIGTVSPRAEWCDGRDGHASHGFKSVVLWASQPHCGAIRTFPRSDLGEGIVLLMLVNAMANLTSSSRPKPLSSKLRRRYSSNNSSSKRNSSNKPISRRRTASTGSRDTPFVFLALFLLVCRWSRFSVTSLFLCLDAMYIWSGRPRRQRGQWCASRAERA